MQDLRIAQHAGRFALIVAIAFAAGAVALVSRAPAPTITVSQQIPDVASAIPTFAPTESSPSAPSDPPTTARPAPEATVGPVRQPIIPIDVAPARTAAPISNTPANHATPGSIVTVSDDSGGVIDPDPRFK